MKVKDTVKSAILKLESLCESYERDPFIKLEELEKTVHDLSQEVQTINLASDQNLKTELNTLQSALLKLSSVLKQQQENFDRQVHEIHLHQRTLHAFARVANSNQCSGVAV